MIRMRYWMRLVYTTDYNHWLHQRVRIIQFRFNMVFGDDPRKMLLLFLADNICKPPNIHDKILHLLYVSWPDPRYQGSNQCKVRKLAAYF